MSRISTVSRDDSITVNITTEKPVMYRMKLGLRIEA